MSLYSCKNNNEIKTIVNNFLEYIISMTTLKLELFRPIFSVIYITITITKTIIIINIVILYKLTK